LGVGVPTLWQLSELEVRVDVGSYDRAVCVAAVFLLSLLALPDNEAQASKGVLVSGSVPRWILLCRLVVSHDGVCSTEAKMSYVGDVRAAEDAYNKAVAEAKSVWVRSVGGHQSTGAYDIALDVARVNYDRELARLRDKYL